ncbi:hypothetical protein I6E29_02770 [Arcanobacterium haemolyticum]|nr:hypothetical protein [Arcanobacterium haemolyticum]
MPAFLRFLKLAAKAGPVVFAMVKSLAPQIQRMIRENPEVFNAMSQRFTRVIGSKKDDGNKKNLAHRISVLRDQVTYLYASANNYEAARTTLFWRNELETLERALPVLDAMSRRQRASHERHLSRRLDNLSAAILSASLIDDVEDAEIIHPHDGAHTTNTDAHTGEDAPETQSFAPDHPDDTPEDGSL